MRIERGEKKLIRRAVTDSNDAAVTFSSLVDVQVTLTDAKGHTVTYTKTGGTIVEGTTTNELEFEITVAQSSGLAIGTVSGEFRFTITNADFSDSEEINIFRENALLKVV